MKIAISGVSGFIGLHLSSYFGNQGDEIVPLTRELFDRQDAEVLADRVSGCDVVVNLAGAPINRRWTQDYKQVIFDSRIKTTRLLVDAINRSAVRPRTFISTSATGYYPSEGCYDEFNAVQGGGFLADLCGRWEEEARKLGEGVRLLITRFGVVLAPRGGALEKMVQSARLGVAAVTGSGRQPFSWIGIEDHVRAMEFVIRNDSLSGAVNFVAPEQVDYSDFIHLAAKHYHSFATLRVPQSLLRTFLGELGEWLTQGQCVIPKKLLDAGFVFRRPTLAAFFDSL